MGGKKMSLITYLCHDNLQKKYRLVFDGGSSGQYVVELCHSCYKKENKRFLISEEILGESFV